MQHSISLPLASIMEEITALTKQRESSMSFALEKRLVCLPGDKWQNLGKNRRGESIRYLESALTHRCYKYLPTFYQATNSLWLLLS